MYAVNLSTYWNCEVFKDKINDAMLRITMNKSASGAKKYYSEMYYSEGQTLQNYYDEKGQSIGTWHGKAAEKLNLTGDINKDDFASLCDNIIPGTKDQLTERKNKDRTVGYDLTFNASKSVSLAHAFANDNDKREILQAFRDSVNDTMSRIEAGMQTRVRKSGKDENRETGNMVYSEHIHFTSRPVDNIPDPHLHAHCFVFNATFDDKEDKWKAGQFRQIKQDAPYYEAMFQSSFANKLSALGYGIEKTKNGFEIKGIERDTIEKFSRRTEEIESLAKEKSITDKKQKSELGSKTRESKRNSISEKDQYAAWQERLNEAELQTLSSLKNLAVANEKKKEVSDAAIQAVDYSLNHHLERKSVSTDKEILTTAIKSSIGETSVEAIQNAFKQNNEIIHVKEENQNWITTHTALREENELIEKANYMKGCFKPINADYEPANANLNDEQYKAVKQALNSNDGITIIAGKAGTGKTTLMKEVQAGINAAGKELFAFAPSAEASRMVQRKEGFENADTVASLIQNKSLHGKLKDSIIWIDEAGLLSNKDANKVLDIAKQNNTRLILTGDIKQHNSVERGDALRTLQTEAGIPTIQVSKVQRQKVQAYKDAVNSLSKSDVEKGFKKLEKMGAIHERADHNSRIDAVATDYYESTYKNTKRSKKENEVLVISPTHNEGEKVTSSIREKLKQNDILSKDEMNVTTFRNIQLTAAEKEKKESYSNDKYLIFHQNCKGFKAGSRYKIQNVNDDTIHLADNAGNISSISMKQASNFNVFEKKTLQLAKGDKIRITGNGKSKDGKHLFNGNLYKVNGFDKNGNIRLSNGSTLPKNYGHLAYGYVVTSHASQGKTVDKVIISQSSISFNASSKEQFYVSVSRGRKGVSIYTDDKEDLLNAVKQSNQRKSAIELTRNRVMNEVIEINRNNILKKIKEKALETADKIMASFNNKNHSYELRR